jgi:enamine deaminase RidA (YjgF/YER057c/UK114 family)
MARTHRPYRELHSLGIVLPPPTAAVGTFAPAVRTGSLIFVSGHIAKRDGRPWTGRIGEALTPQEGYQAARAVAIDILGTLESTLLDLAVIRRIVKLTVFINADPAFIDHPAVANGASDLFRDVFGAAGLHARAAVGVAQLPFGSCVEVELVAEVDDAK